jgi:hypothetical protein
VGLCEHGNEHCVLQNESNLSTRLEPINNIKRILLPAVS